MGIYINPTSGTKETWLEEHNIFRTNNFSLDPDLEELVTKIDYKHYFPVCLVDNGLFTAAAVGDTPREFDCFKQIDGRPKLWYVVSKEYLMDKSSGLIPSEIQYLKQLGDS